MLFETLLPPNTEQKITNIFVRNNVTFFKLNGESFCTAAGGIHHSSSPMYDGPLIKVFAGEAHDPEKKREYEREIQKQDYEFQLWEKHKVQAMKTIIQKAMEMPTDELMVELLDKFVTIDPEENAIMLVKKMEDEC